ncbi:MAG: hypothetical protein AB7O45_02790 [Alphaproteobacteria bacterium]
MTLQITVNGKTRDMTEEEIAELAASMPTVDEIRATAAARVREQAARLISLRLIDTDDVSDIRAAAQAALAAIAAATTEDEIRAVAPAWPE